MTEALIFVIILPVKEFDFTALARKGTMMGKDLGFSILLDFYGDMLTEKQRDIIALYYNQDLSLAEIAEHEQITRQGVRDHIKRGEAFLCELEEKLHFAEKFQRLVAVSDAVAACCQEIERVNSGFMQSQAIAQNAAEIRRLLNEYIDQNF